MIRALLLAFVATAAAANAPMSKLAGSRVALPKALPKALELRGGGKPSAELSIKLTQAAGVFYSLQCLLVPDMMVSQHFNIESSPLMLFWIRGMAVPMLTVTYLLNKVPTAEAAKVCAAFNIAIGAIFPWNAAFISKFDCKPFHRVPELLFAALSAVSLAAL